MFGIRGLALSAFCITGFACVISGYSHALSERDLYSLEERLKTSRALEKELEKKASGLGQEVDIIGKRLVAAARSAQDNEELLSALEDRARELETLKITLERKIAKLNRNMSTVLIGIERVAWRPPGALMFQSGHQKDTVRGAILLRSVIPEIRKRTDHLKEEFSQLTTTRHELAEQQIAIQKASSDLDARYKSLVTLYKRKKALVRHTQKKYLQATEQAQSLAREAKDMRDLLKKLAKTRQHNERIAKNRTHQATIQRPRFMAPDSGKSLKDMKMPARGTLVLGYGDPTGKGLTTRGMTLQTRPEAQVIAPASGTIAFAGTFRGYGLLLIIEQPGDYHVLLSGMSRIDPVVGQTVRVGEPVGVMGRDEKAKLYVELRRAGQPVNPMPWLSAYEG